MMISKATQAALIRAFRWLAAPEPESLAGITGDRHELLLERVTALIDLRRILPANSDYDAAALAEHWEATFASRDEVPIHELRVSAKRWLQQRTCQRDRSQATVAPNQIERWLSLDQGSLSSAASAAQPPAFSLAVKRTCAEALVQWQKELELNPQWNQPNEAVPLDHPASQTDAYLQRLQLRQRLPTGSSPSASQQPTPNQPPTVRGPFDSLSGVEHLFTSASNQCTIIGEPGVGKSAMVQWLTWATQHGIIPEFELAIAVRLADYARYLELRPQLGVVEFFVASKLNEYTQHRDAAKCLQSAASKSGRFMFLLDGWDQVPPHFRRTVRAAIRRDAGDFYTIITTRVTGSSTQVFDEGETYEMLGFEHSTSVDLEGTGLPDADSTPRTEPNPVYQSLKTNTLLHAMARRLLTAQPTLNQAQVFQQVCSWLVEHARETSDADTSFTPKHLQSLESLAFQMSLGGLTSTQTFHEDETELGPVLPQAIARTRFVRRVPGPINRWAFLHESLQQFLAARHLSNLHEDLIEQHWRKALLAKHRVGVLTFFAGLNAQTQLTSMRLALAALQTPDRFRQQVDRIARIAAAANWHREFPDVWQQICDHKATRQHQAKAFKHTPHFDHDARKRIARETPQHAPFHAKHSDIATASALQKTAVDRGNDPLEQLLSSDQPATALADREERLLHRVAIDAPRFDTDRWIQVLTSDRPLPGRVREPLTHIACGQLQRDRPTTICDPSPLAIHLRDRLIASLTLLRSVDIRVPGLLLALSGSPIAAGQQLLLGWVRLPTTPLNVRLAACSLLHHATDPNVVQQAVDRLPTEQSPELADALIRLAFTRHPKLNYDWLKNRIRSASKEQGAELFRETDLATLIAVYVTTLTENSPKSNALDFIEPFIAPALAETTNSKPNGRHARRLATELSRPQPTKSIVWPRSLKQIARDTLNHAANDNVSTAGSVGLALVILAGEPDWAGRAQRALDHALSIANRSDRVHDIDTWHWLATHVTSSMAKHSLATLLRYPHDTECIRQALQRHSNDGGATIFARRAYDAEGRCVVDLDDDFITPNANNQSSHIRHDTWNALPPMQHRALRSFQLVTEYIGSSATLEEIHATIDSGAESFPTSVREQLEQLYRDVRFPTFSAWRRSLNHATRKLHRSPDGQSLLQELGLPRRSSY